MGDDTKSDVFMCCFSISIILIAWFSVGSVVGYQRYFQYPSMHRETDCTVNDTFITKTTRYQIVWTVKYNDNESEKISKIFEANYGTYTDAVEVILNKYKAGEIYKCYFNFKKPYDVVWTLNDKIRSGRNQLIIASVCGMLLLIIWIVPISYFSYKSFKTNRLIKKTCGVYEKASA